MRQECASYREEFDPDTEEIRAKFDPLERASYREEFDPDTEEIRAKFDPLERAR